MDAKDGYRISVIVAIASKDELDESELVFSDINKAVRDPRVVQLLADGRLLVLMIQADDPPFSQQLAVSRDKQWVIKDWDAVRAAMSADVSKVLQRGLDRSASAHWISRFVATCPPPVRSRTGGK